MGIIRKCLRHHKFMASCPTCMADLKAKCAK